MTRPSFREHERKLFESFLFRDTKSAWDKNENQRYLHDCIVKTSTFLKVRDREVSFLVGRKGSGKSTITHVLPLLSNRPPMAVVRIDFEQLPLTLCFNELSSRMEQFEELAKTFSPLYSYQLVWDAFLHLICAWELRESLPERSHLRRLLLQLVDTPVDSIIDETERTAVITKSLFAYSLRKLLDFVGPRTHAALSPLALPAKVASFTPSKFRDFVLGPKCAAIIATALNQITASNGRILITVDGFDTMTGYFTSHGHTSRDQNDFELEILLALLQTVLNKGPARLSGGKIYDVSDFCIAIPYDRFIALRVEDRDRYQYRHRFAAVEWSGMELSALIRKRLALLAKVPDPRGRLLEDRFSDVMRRGFPQFPDQLDFHFGSRKYRLPLFSYVLRHTFWRPRDVLFYFAALLTAFRPYERAKRQMPTEFVRQVIAGSTRFIVEDEFIKEFEDSFRNLRQVISAFRHAPQVLSWNGLKKRLDPLRFDMSTQEIAPANLEWKVEQLYNIGALGIILDYTTADKLSAYRHAFSFNEGRLLSDKLGRDLYPSLQYALHPVFEECLLLNTSQNPELVLPMGWADLHLNEEFRQTRPIT
ncbi:MAG: hypothetical protein P0119_03690 [Nitrospira sp.]|nr:hypothetical protein [Nitrospira sp.]